MKRIALAAVALALGTGAACAKDLWNAEQLKLVAETSNKIYASQQNPQMGLEMIPGDSSMKIVIKYADETNFGAQWDSMNDDQKKMVSDMMVKQMCDTFANAKPDENLISHVEFVEIAMTNADASKTFTSVNVNEEACAAAK